MKRLFLTAAAVWVGLAPMSAAQEDEQFRVTHRYMRDGVWTPVGFIYEVTNLTDQYICVRPVVHRRENMSRMTAEDVVRLRPRQRNARLINFFIRRVEEDGVVGVTAEIVPDCPQAASLR